MRVLNMRSGGGSPEHDLADYEYSQLETALGVSFDEDARKRLQGALNHALYWGSLEYDANIRPIIKFYDDASKKLKALAQLLDAGPKTDDHDAQHMAKYAFDANRAYKKMNPDFVHLRLTIGFAATDFSRAKKAIETFHSIPSSKGRKASRGLDLLVCQLAEFAESVGVTPNAAYSEHRDGNSARRTPFVEFFDLMREMIGDKLTESIAKSESIVLRVLASRSRNRKERAKQQGGNASPAMDGDGDRFAVGPRPDETEIFARVFDEPEKPRKATRKRRRSK